VEPHPPSDPHDPGEAAEASLSNAISTSTSTTLALGGQAERRADGPASPGSSLLPSALAGFVREETMFATTASVRADCSTPTFNDRELSSPAAAVGDSKGDGLSSISAELPDPVQAVASDAGAKNDPDPCAAASVEAPLAKQVAVVNVLGNA
jgi:hypothetical protein